MGQVKTLSCFSGRGYEYIHKYETSPLLSEYQIHSHDSYELLIFLKGEADFVIEGAVYPLSPMDAIVTRPEEMHQIYPREGVGYERVILTVSDSFFADYDCNAYRSIFTDRKAATENILQMGEKHREFLDTIKRLEGYIRQEKNHEAVIRSACIELLYGFNQLKPAETVVTPQSESIRRITEYINQNLSEELSLETLAERFYVSKYYLCRMFKKYTGMTLWQYITRKRILTAKALRRQGLSVGEAAFQAGFSDYSAFYKACVKETGLPPKKGLQA